MRPGKRKQVDVLEKAIEAALDHIGRAKRWYAKTGLNADWLAVVADVRERHFRKKGFMDGFDGIVSGATKHIEPSFLKGTLAKKVMWMVYCNFNAFPLTS